MRRTLKRELVIFIATIVHPGTSLLENILYFYPQSHTLFMKETLKRKHARNDDFKIPLVEK